MSIAVIYLYYVPYKIEVLQTFIQSSQQNQGGIEFDLYVIFKDANDVESVQLAKEWLQRENVNYTELHFKGGFDIDAYYFAANQIATDFIVFFNSSSKILHSHWLIYLANAVTDNMGAAGATGSYQSYYEVIYSKAKNELVKPQTVTMRWQLFKLILKSALLYKKWFPKFPNPHLRTNALLIRRDLFLQVQIKLPIKKKIDAYRFESGKDSLTNQLLKLGFQVCLVDKNGYSYLPEKWHLSKIFWCNKQVNLLVSDNQTLLYQYADIKIKKLLSYYAWGNLDKTDC